MVPKLWNKPAMYSTALIRAHLWISTLGIVFYITSMWAAGIMQGLMWRAYTANGFLEYSFIETVEAMFPFYVVRAMGGGLFLIGALIMAFNIYKTIASPELAEASEATPALAPAE
jgi:cytochrome c oxidase cbb3-type subunit 1